MRISKKEYIDAICDGSSDEETWLSPLQKKRLETALEKALENRKNEIELYWKRTQYFWGFLVTIYGTYFLVYLKTEVTNSDPDFQKKLILLILSTLGFFFAIGWHLANRGSKLWQENWENHVDTLENYIHGPLYKTIIVRTDYKNSFSPVNPYPFSVSRINGLLSAVLVISGVGLMISEVSKWCSSWIFWLWVAVVSGVLLAFCSFTHGSIHYEYKKHKKDPEQPVYFMRKND